MYGLFAGIPELNDMRYDVPMFVPMPTGTMRSARPFSVLSHVVRFDPYEPLQYLEEDGAPSVRKTTTVEAPLAPFRNPPVVDLGMTFLDVQSIAFPVHVMLRYVRDMRPIQL
jgi:hypothetical protein